MNKEGRPNRSGVDWSDPAAAKSYLKEWRARHRQGAARPESGIKKSIRINGVFYPTLAEAARAIGISKQRMSQIVKRDGYDIER